MFLLEASMGTTHYFFIFLNSIKKGAYNRGQRALEPFVLEQVLIPFQNRSIRINVFNQLFAHPNVYWVLFLDHAQFIAWTQRHHLLWSFMRAGGFFFMHAGGSGPTTASVDTWLMLVLLSQWTTEVFWTLTNSLSPASRPFCTTSNWYPPTPPPSPVHLLLALTVS